MVFFGRGRRVNAGIAERSTRAQHAHLARFLRLRKDCRSSPAGAWQRAPRQLSRGVGLQEETGRASSCHYVCCGYVSVRCSPVCFGLGWGPHPKGRSPAARNGWGGGGLEACKKGTSLGNAMGINLQPLRGGVGEPPHTHNTLRIHVHTISDKTCHTHTHASG